MIEINKKNKVIFDVINQVFEIEKKISNLKETNSIQRNINKLKELIEIEFSNIIGIEQSGFIYHNPIGESFDETRTDCEASIAGENTNDLIITEVIKPIIRYCKGSLNIIVQKAVVIVESKNN